MGGGESDAGAPFADADETELDPLRAALLDWSDREGRDAGDVPWRGDVDPYGILVAEVMSQQTQLDRAVAAWTEFVDVWPTVDSLATADRSAVVGFWTDHRLGYNNRARYLHEAAERVVEAFDGTIPSDPEALETLPGVGPYTASAVAAFAFGEPTAVVETNVKRVLYRAFGVADDDGAFEAAADRLLPDDEPARWNHALMDLGATVCTKTPACDDCPWRERCQAHATGDFTAPDVPTQPAFEGSRRQARGRVLAALRNGDLALDELGPRVRVDFQPGDPDDRAWLRDLLGDLSDDGLVAVEGDRARLRD
jgi:A/G-specific adenine glycosylase